MAVKLHRCSNVWVKIGGHPCWRVQRELDAAGIEYEVVKHPLFGREEALKATGQKKYPWIEFEDATVLREESADMAERIKSGRLFEGRDKAQPAPSGG
jgi:glutathione S-transferase